MGLGPGALGVGADAGCFDGGSCFDGGGLLCWDSASGGAGGEGQEGYGVGVFEVHLVFLRVLFVVDRIEEGWLID